MSNDESVDRALAALEKAPSSAWRDVRVVVRRRRRTRAAIAVGVVAVAAAAGIVVPRLGGTDGNPTAPPVPLAEGITQGERIGDAVELVANVAPLTVADPAAVSALGRAQTAFTARLLQQVGDGSQNVATSPASLAIALSMLQNGAAGRTLDEISAALGSSVAGANAGWAGLSSEWSAAAEKAGIRFSSANSLWQQRGFALTRPFVSALTRYFHSGVWQVDFGGHPSAALDALDRWTSQHTNGRIPKLFDSLDPATVLVLANAVYFKARWQTPFDPDLTEPGQFAAPGGATTAQFMTSPGMLATASSDDYQAAEIPYAGGRFAALAIMPTHDALPTFVRGLDGADIASVASSLTATAEVDLPRFTVESSLDLQPVLEGLGIRRAWTDLAEFPGVSRQPTKIGQAIQRVYLKVGEKGTEAAAATGIAMMPTSGTLVRPVRFDHPFLFLVRDTKTGAILFAARINSPDGG